MQSPPEAALSLRLAVCSTVRWRVTLLMWTELMLLSGARHNVPIKTATSERHSVFVTLNTASKFI